MPFPEPLRPLATMIAFPVDPEVIRGLLAVESPARDGASQCNQQLSPKLLLTIRPYVHTTLYVHALFGHRAGAIRRDHVRQQEIRHALVGVDLILHPRESVPFVFVNLRVHGASALLDRVDHLLRF